METRQQQFEACRTKLMAIAYRMLGTSMDAEDVLQEVCIKWLQQDHSTIASPEAWLTTTTTRQCIDHMRKAHVVREQYLGTWLPEPIIISEDQDRQASMIESLSTAFLILLETLTPTERAVFILRDVFEYEYDQIGATLETSEASCRKLLSRARSKIRSKKPLNTVSREQQSQLLQQFLHAIEQENVQQLESLLATDAIQYSDHGGKAISALRPIYSNRKIARLLVGLRHKQTEANQTLELTDVNGSPGLVFYKRGVPRTIMTFLIEGNLIKTIYNVRNPDKLRNFQRH